MIQYPNIDPVIFRIGPLALRWYGLMYVFGFASSYLLAVHQLKKKAWKIDRAQLDDLYFYLILGLILGGRLGYILFYNLSFYLANPLEVFVLWHGGMSFHGGLIGAFLAGYVIIRKRGLKFFEAADLIIPTCPPGLMFGRIGNFINGELFGKPSTAPWAMVFPQGGEAARHPSQLYEAGLEGLVLFAILWIYKDRKKREGDVLALFLMLYGAFRIICELFREPDAQVGYILGILSMGQILSLFMVGLGVFLKYAHPKG
ncbi:MAG: prolipoprotein diacylglyceryl transferase [Syntrophorhabdus aromaticivorans]|uniref:Phosphatidylglycerol--prolipoprotein diacylglyceryl transferase n=1 Tax=Syntrophorhabdus aromaticivorans TaxID=328301 RepID=A0A351U4Y7_9BACT|nr:prolipoprotein diacylglyceryl transferase [Syntrophorhabdus aromaticivorans]HBA55018.1 prolipoprotein diacylglyceryl transferase [Syntrophorhabdus aromaticivorans]